MIVESFLGILVILFFDNIISRNSFDNEIFKGMRSYPCE